MIVVMVIIMMVVVMPIFQLYRYYRSGDAAPDIPPSRPAAAQTGDRRGRKPAPGSTMVGWITICAFAALAARHAQGS